MKRILFLLLAVSAFAKTNFSQTTYTTAPLTPDGIFDTVYDHLGTKYLLKNLIIDSPMDLNGQNARPAPTLSCSAGYFDLYFAFGSVFDGTSAAAVNKRTTLCQVFTDISNFINSSLPSTVRINIYCDNTSGPTAGALGSASPFFVIPTSPTNPNQGFADNQIYKALVTGVDPYANLPITIFPGANSFYYGVVAASNTIPWHDDMSTNNLSTTDFDFYSVMLHEVTHALGFFSLINSRPSKSQFQALIIKQSFKNDF